MVECRLRLTLKRSLNSAELLASEWPFVSSRWRLRPAPSSEMAERASRLGVITRGVGPVAGQGSQCPDQSKQTKPSAPGNAGAPGKKSAQSRGDGRRGYTGGPHQGPGARTDALHRKLICLHAKERKMFKDPANSRRPALGITCSANGIGLKANAYKPTDQPMCNCVRGKIQKNPCQKHRGDRNRSRAC